MKQIVIKVIFLEGGMLISLPCTTFIQNQPQSLENKRHNDI